MQQLFATTMAPSTTVMDYPPSSTLENTLNVSKAALESPENCAHLYHLASTILHNLQYQHDWTALAIHTHSSSNGLPLPRPVISGLPPRRAYIHPDEQVEILKAEHKLGKPVEQHPEQEWVLPTHLEEKWSLAKFSSVFDALDTVPKSNDEMLDEGENEVGQEWRGNNRQKRLLLATLHDDSTVVYYIMHDGIVKPRQN
jgi:tRNA-splicing endonuclease subunit Sen15